MKTVFAILFSIACCNAYAGCPGGVCHLKKASQETYTVSPAVSSPVTTKTVTKTTKTRSYRSSKWR